MDAHATNGALPGTQIPADMSRIVRTAVIAATWLLLAVGLFLLVRRLSGALVEPLSPSALLVLGALAALAAWSARTAWRGASSWVAGSEPKATAPMTASASDLFVRFAPSVALLSMAAALSLPGTQTSALALFWALLVSSELETHFRLRRRWARRFSPGRQAGAKELSVPPFQHDEHDEHIVQQLTRVRDAELGEMVYGTLRADFEPNQRSVSLHVAFCPPFAMTPQMDIEQTDGPESRLKLGQVLPYGARIDVRLRQAFTEPQRVVIELCAREKKSASA